MFTLMPAKKGIKLFMEHTVAYIVKSYTQLDNINVLGTVNPYVLTTLKTIITSRRKDAVKLKVEHVLIVVHRGFTCLGNTLHCKLHP